jgi:hypothetical protein
MNPTRSTDPERAATPPDPPKLENPPTMHSSLILRQSLIRAALVLASFVATSTLMLTLGALFDDASRQPWLSDTPQARSAVAACHAQAARDARRHCLRAVVAEAQARDAGASRLAALTSSSQATR